MVQYGIFVIVHFITLLKPNKKVFQKEKKVVQMVTVVIFGMTGAVKPAMPVINKITGGGLGGGGRKQSQ